MSKILYISYDGALDPLGGSQVVPYVLGLARAGYQMTLLTYEKADKLAAQSRVDALRAKLAAASVEWLPQPYHSGLSVLTTTIDLLLGGLAVSRRGKFDLLHARSYPSALLAQQLARLWRVPWVFDVRGFYPEERVDGGIWPKDGALFKLTKRLERSFDGHAAAIVTLTHASVPIIEKRVRAARGKAQVHMIPTCVDLDRFTPRLRDQEKFTLAYVGSLGTWYLTEPMMRFAKLAQQAKEDVHIRFVTNDPVTKVTALAAQHGVDLQRFSVDSVAHEDVSDAVGPAGATFFFIQPAFSKVASAATKFGESLAMGLPVVINAGVGDSEQLVVGRGLGLVVKDFSDEALSSAAQQIRAMADDQALRARCRRVADEVFSLQRGVQSYVAIYQSLLGAR